jgi:hypothetical protein
MRMTTRLPFEDVPEQALLTVSHLEVKPGVTEPTFPGQALIVINPAAVVTDGIQLLVAVGADVPT